MSEDKEWGVGDKAEAEAWGHSSMQDGTPLELVWGQYPHSRSDNRVYARFPDGSIEAFDGHRPVLTMKFEASNYLKTSGLSGNEVRKGGNAQLFADDELVYSFFFREPDHALLQMHKLLLELSEHPANVLQKSSREKLIGREVYYRDHPATITAYDPDEGCVTIESADGEPFPMPAWVFEHEGKGDGFGSPPEAIVRDALLSSHIWWFRDRK